MALTEISAHTEEKTAPGVHGESRSRCLWAADCMCCVCLVRRQQEISMMSLLIVSKGSCAPHCSQLVLRHPTVTCLCFPGVPSQSCFSQEGLHKPANPNHTCFRFLCISHQRCVWCVWGGRGTEGGREGALGDTVILLPWRTETNSLQLSLLASGNYLQLCCNRVLLNLFGSQPRHLCRQ